METKQLITRSMARIPERTYYRFMGLQTLVFMSGLRTAASSMLACFGHPEINDPLELTPIAKVFIAPREILIEKNRDYIYVAFDYIPQRTGMEVVKITEQYNTTSFKERISKN